MSDYEILFDYDEDKQNLRVEYDADKNEVTITGGKEGYTGLAQWFQIYSQQDFPPEEKHWHETVETDYLFDIKRK